jgi:hypothetical protein
LSYFKGHFEREDASLLGGGVMKILLKIYLMGLVALIPTTRDHGMVIVLQNTRQSDSDTPHLPVLVWDSKVSVLVTADGVPQADQERDIRRNLLLMPNLHPTGLILNGEAISIEGTKTGEVSLRDKPRRPWYAWFRGAIPKNYNEYASTAWIPKMNRISRRACRVRREIIDNPNPRDVAGIFRLAASASLSTFHIAGWKDSDRSFTFKTSSEAHPFLGHRGAMADVALLTVPVEVQVKDGRLLPITVVLRRFGSAEAPQERRIAIQPRQGAQSIDLLIGNLTAPILIPEELTPDVSHFSLYYRLADAKYNHAEKTPFLGKRIAEKENLVIPEVIYNVSGDCDYSLAPDEKNFHRGGPMSSAQGHRLALSPADLAVRSASPPFGGLCRPICGVLMMQEPVH